MYSQRDWENLNKAVIREAPEGGGGIVWELQDYSTTGTDGKTLVFFKELERHLIHFIEEADIVLGCVAWLTSEPILQALSKKRGVSIVVQKEDFLRPDLGSDTNWHQRLHRLYNALPQKLDIRDFTGIVQFARESINAVRCVGNYNIDKRSAFPRSHHKFALFCRVVERCNCKECQEKVDIERDFFSDMEYGKKAIHIYPYAVWTGSFNFTKTASQSFENAIVLFDEKIINAFYHEYQQIAVLSESLDWTRPWMKPDGHVEAPST